MSAHVLLNLLNELRKRDKMWGLQSILSLFHNEFNKFNNTGARTLDSIYHMSLKLFKNCSFGVNTVKNLPSFSQCGNGRYVLGEQIMILVGNATHIIHSTKG